MTTPTAPADPAHPRWIDYVDLDELQRAPRNPKGHADALIAESMEVHGYVEAVTVDERTGKLVAGHGRLDSLLTRRAGGGDPPDGVVADDEGRWLVPVQRGWRSTDDAQAENYLLVSNQGTIEGGWLDDELHEMLRTKVESEDPEALAGSGFYRDEVLERLAAAAAADDDDQGERSDGSLLSLTDVTVGEPKHQAHHGDHFILGGRHHLVVARIVQEWPVWVALLTGDRLFVPYPGVYVALSNEAETSDLVMVQPIAYVAGHILDKYAALHGDAAIARAPK